MRVGRNWYISFNGVNLKSEYGLILSSYETELPAPKVIKVDIPAGADRDITDAIGSIGYHMGKHTFKFLLHGDTATDRKEKLRAITSLVHGVRANYVLSWESNYKYTGRGRVYVEHLTLMSDLVTIEIERDPWKTSSLESIDVNSHPSGVASLVGSKTYTNVAVILREAATVKVGSGTATSYEAGTHSLATSLNEDTDITINVGSGGWVLYTVDGSTDLKMNTAKVSISDTDLVVDDSYVISNGDIIFSTEYNQHSTVRFRRKDV